MALPQRDQLLVTVSSNKGWTCSPRGLLQQPGSSRRPLETTARAHLYHAQETAVLSHLFCHLPADRRTAGSAAAKLGSGQEAEGVFQQRDSCHGRQIKNLISLPSCDAEASVTGEMLFLRNTKPLSWPFGRMPTVFQSVRRGSQRASSLPVPQRALRLIQMPCASAM